MKIYLSVALSVIFSSFVLPAPAQSKYVYNVLDYGARGDNKTIDTKSINQAIDAAVLHGGGTIWFPAGKYLSGSIHLKSNICLYIDQGATIIAAGEGAESGYDDPEQTTDNMYEDFGHRHWHNSLIWGENIHDVSIIGSGLLWGKGLAHAAKNAEMNNEGDKSPNKTIALYKCRNVTLRDFSILHGGWFGLLATGVDNLTIDNVKMDTNRDGMDIDCCQNVHISNCSINSPHDDGICLKSSYSLNTGRATENVTITNCQVSGFDEGSFLDGTYKRDDRGNAAPTGRIKLGTESNGGFKNIAISNCVFNYCRGLALETVDGAQLEDITITNITMRDVVNSPIFVRLGARMRAPANTPVGTVKRVIISNVICYNADSRNPSIISGIPGHDITDLTLNNIRIYSRGGGVPPGSTVVPELEKEYPEPARFKDLPAYGFFVRHVADLKMKDVEVSYLNEDKRPPFMLDSVSGADIEHIRGQKAKNSSTFLLNNVTAFVLHNSHNLPDINQSKINNKEL